MTAPTPPSLAEAILRLLLAPRDRDAVSGDLLEEYRESVHPSRGQLGADLWYLGQVAGFFWRSYAAPALLLCAAFLGRTALDWLAPPADFHGRSTVSTLVGIGLLTIAGFLAAWRSRSTWAGTFAGVAIPLIVAPVAIVGICLLLAFNHDPQTMAAIRASGGLAEAFTFPLLLMIPGALFGTLGGVIAAGARRIG